MPVKTVEARVLLGWMERDMAIRYLQQDCYFDPAVSVERAEELWMRFKDNVESLPERLVPDPRRFSLTQTEKVAANQFRGMYNFAPNIVDVIKVNPMELLVHQLYVVTELSDGYAEAVKGKGWVDLTLLCKRDTTFKWRGEPPNRIIYEFPHGECLLNGPLPPDGHIEILTGARFANAVYLDGRMLLGTGYHRTFAYCRNAINVPDGIGKAAVFALTNTLPFPDSPAAPNQGLRGLLLGTRPPFFSDFFDDRLFMAVKLRKKKHYELRIQVEHVGVDDES